MVASRKEYQASQARARWVTFPNWNWQGWEGHAIYPWAVEREYSISNKDSPLLFKSATSRRFWFGMDEYRTGGRVLDLREWQLIAGDRMVILVGEVQRTRILPSYIPPTLS
jgi:hypothetical protein